MLTEETFLNILSDNDVVGKVIKMVDDYHTRIEEFDPQLLITTMRAFFLQTFLLEIRSSESSFETVSTDLSLHKDLYKNSCEVMAKQGERIKVFETFANQYRASAAELEKQLNLLQ